VVATPAGEVTVQGTCFRVEVEQMKPVVAAGIGAVVATTVLVSVYEGRVLLANEHGKTVLSAGEQASARSGERPAAAGSMSAPAFVAALQQNSAPPEPGVTREQLLQRDQQQRAELEKLRARVHELESSSPADAKAKKEERPFFDPSKDDLQGMAKDCKLKWDHPSISLNPSSMNPKRAAEMGFSDQERAEVDRIAADENARVLKELRALYIEVTGDKGGADSLAPQALENEIMSKSPESVVQQVFFKLSHERAGLQATAPGTSAVERLMRLMTGLGDDYEQKLGAAIGPDRARQFRAEHNGWDNRSQSSFGCPDE
jgi:hypothetical protein